MANLKDWILKEAKDEQIEYLVLGEMGWSTDYKSEKVPNYSSMPKGKLLTFEEALPYMDYEFSDDFGAPECQAIYVWTKTKVMFIFQYYGSTWLESVPRNPIDILPTMPGG